MEIKEINGVNYRVTKSGGLLKITPKRTILSGVYCITDLSNNKKYIGSSKDIHKRIRAYTQPSKISGVLRDINDLKNINVDILELCSNTLERELHHIKELNTIYPAGYNKKNPITGKNFEGVSYTKRSSLLFSKPIEKTLYKGKNRSILEKYKDIEY